MVHTIEEINELKNWFEEHQAIIPQTMQINAGVYSPDLSETISMLFEQAYICYENSKMQGCILLLKQIKTNLENNELNK